MHAAAWPTNRLKYHVTGVCRHTAGRKSRRCNGRSIFTRSSHRCTYQTVSGRSGWPSRDPLGDYAIFKNSIRGLDKEQAKQLKVETLMPPYGFVRNDSIGKFDTDGRGLGPVVGIAGGIGLGVAGVYGACWLHLDHIQDQANAAVGAEMRKLDPNYDPISDGPKIEGTPADALRHCIGACLANQKPCFCFGRNKTQALIQGREDYTGPTDLAHDMDRANNTIAFGIPLNSDCVKTCVDALKNGGLNCFTVGDQNLSPCKLSKNP